MDTNKITETISGPSINYWEYGDLVEDAPVELINGCPHYWNSWGYGGWVKLNPKKKVNLDIHRRLLRSEKG